MKATGIGVKYILFSWSLSLLLTCTVPVELNFSPHRNDEVDEVRRKEMVQHISVGATVFDVVFSPRGYFEA